LPQGAPELPEYLGRTVAADIWLARPPVSTSPARFRSSNYITPDNTSENWPANCIPISRLSKNAGWLSIKDALLDEGKIEYLVASLCTIESSNPSAFHGAHKVTALREYGKDMG
jgi:hypothetical protein